MVIKMNVPKLRFEGFYNQWDEHTINDAFNIITDFVAAGSFASLRENVKYYNDKNFAQLIRTIDIKINFKNKDFVYVDEKAYKFLWRVVLNEDSIILPNIGSNIGEKYYIEHNKLPYQNNVLGPNSILLRSNTHNLKFLYYVIQHRNFNIQLKNLVGASGQPKFNKTDLKKIKIKIPEIEEQEKIENMLSLLDKKIELQSQKIEALKLYKKGLLLNYFKGKKTNKIIKDIIKYGKAGGTPKSSVKEYYNGKIPFLSISDMTKQGKYIYNTERNISEIGLKNSSAWLVPEDSIILSMYASYGLVAINKIKLSTSQAMFNMILNDNVFVEYIYQYLNYLNISNYYDKLISTGTQSNLNAEKIYNIKIFIPEFNEQKLIANLLNCIDILIEFNIKKKKNYHKLKKGLMQNMFV